MKNNNTPNIKNQVKFKIADPSPIQELITQPVQFLIKENLGVLAVLNRLLYLANQHFYIYPSVDHLAVSAKVHHRTCQRHLRRLKDLGLVTAYDRPDMTSYYRLASMFIDLNTRSILSKLLSACKWIPIVFLFVSKPLLPQFTAYNWEFVTQSINIKSSLSSPSYIYNNQDKKRRRLDFEERPRSFKKERNVKQFKQDLPPEFMKALDNAEIVIGLTPIGMKELISFPAAAIDAALHEYKQSKLQGIRDRYRFFCSLCTKHCKELQLIPDYEIVKKLNLSKDAPRCEQLSSNDNVKQKSYHKREDREVQTSTQRLRNYKPVSYVKDVNIEQEKVGLSDLVDPQNINIFAAIVLHSIKESIKDDQI